MAASHLLAHLFGLLRGHFDLLKNGFHFAIVVENNTPSWATDFCAHFCAQYNAGKEQAFETLRREIAAARGLAMTFWSPNLLNNVSFFHEIDLNDLKQYSLPGMIAAAAGTRGGGGGTTSHSSASAAAEIASPLTYTQYETSHVLPRNALAKADRVGFIVGMNTTSRRKNVGFKRLETTISMAMIDFHPLVVTTAALHQSFTPDSVVRTMLDQARRCPKRLTRPRGGGGGGAGAGGSAKSAGGSHSGVDARKSVLSSDQQKLRLYVYGKGALPSFKDDLITTLAHGLYIQWTIMMLRLLQIA